MEITGIILAGGKSSRMGKDKGLCNLNNKPLIEWALEAIHTNCSNIIIGSSNQEYERYGFPVVADEVKGIGPLGGLHACLKASKTDLNFVLSCDMPFVSDGLIKHLLVNASGYEVVMPTHNGYLEPLCAVYSQNVLVFIEKAIHEKTFKLQKAVNEAKTKFIEISPSLEFYNEMLFFNINSPSELKNIEL